MDVVLIPDSSLVSRVVVDDLAFAFSRVAEVPEVVPEVLVSETSSPEVLEVALVVLVYVAVNPADRNLHSPMWHCSITPNCSALPKFSESRIVK